jgi:hypothetical protein
MSKAKVVLLSLLTAFALSAMMSATASANATHVYLVENTELGSGAIPATEAVEGDSLLGKTEIDISSNVTVLECSEDLVTGEIKKGGESKFEIKFKNCIVGLIEKGKLAYQPSCGVTEPVTAKATGNLTSRGVNEFSSFTSAPVITVCTLAGTYTVGGTQLCATPESSVSKEIHSLQCTPAGSALTLKSASSQLFGEEQIKLTSGRIWSAT